MNDMNMEYVGVFSLDKNIVQIKNKNMNIFRQIFIHIISEVESSINEAKKHHLVPKLTISSLKICLPFISFF